MSSENFVFTDRYRGRDFLSLHDFTPADTAFFIDTALWLKEKRRRGEQHDLLQGKTLGMIFQKQSTRTRVSFEAGMYQLGGYALFLSSNELQLGRGETVADTARVLSRYLDGIVIRTYSHAEVEELAANACIPVINALTDLLHPCQALADLMTIREKKGRLQGLRLAYVGDGNNMVNSLLEAGAKSGMDVTVATPRGYEPDAGIVARAREDAVETGAGIHLTSTPAEAVRGADVVYTDVWTSMGQEARREERLRAFAGYQVTLDLMRLAAPEAVFLHCLPAHRGEEVAAGVIDGPQSVVFDQAENRLHVHKALLALMV